MENMEKRTDLEQLRSKTTRLASRVITDLNESHFDLNQVIVRMDYIPKLIESINEIISVTPEIDEKDELESIVGELEKYPELVKNNHFKYKKEVEMIFLKIIDLLYRDRR